MTYTHRAVLFVGSVALIAFLVLPSLGYAQRASDGGVGSADPSKQDTSKTPSKSSFQLVSCDGAQKYLKDANGKMTNDLDPNSVPCDYNQFIRTIERMMKFVLWLLTPIAVGMMVYTGFKYVTAGGDVNLLADAKRMITPILLGSFFIMAGWLLVYTVLDKLLDTQVSTGVAKTDILPAKVGP